MAELKKLYVLVNSDGAFKGDIFPAFINRANAEAELQKESGKIQLFQEIDQENAQPLPAQNPTLPEPSAFPPPDNDPQDGDDDEDDNAEDDDVDAPSDEPKGDVDEADDKPLFPSQAEEDDDDDAPDLDSDYDDKPIL